MKKIAVLGSTGSIGMQALEVISHQPELYCVTALAAYRNVELLAQQIDKYRPQVAVMIDRESAKKLKSYCVGTTKLLVGEEGLAEAATLVDNDIVLTAMVGAAGIKPTIAAIKAGKDIALANKETLVAAGNVVTELAAKHGSMLIPVDSEHSALFQCMQGEDRQSIDKIILTASGGPFRGRTTEQLKNITVEECLKHPNWTMGRKITVDSATLANKGLEVIEAKWLFDVPIERVEVVVHPQSIIHSMIEFKDGSTMAQLGQPDMRLPIQYAFTWPNRFDSPAPRLDWSKVAKLEFMQPDTSTFRCLKLAYQAGAEGGTRPCVFNAANEVANAAFLERKIAFLDIADVIEQVMSEHSIVLHPTLDEILDSDLWARRQAEKFIKTTING